MTLDEAINHAKDIAAKGGECAKDHEQLAEWLEELRGIVRCRDCANYHDGISQYTGRRFAEPHCLAIGALAYGALFEVSENDYCSWGERRDA